MITATPRIAYMLGYAGLIPFIACAILAWFDEPVNPFFVFHVFHIYSIVILSFLCGSWWGFAYTGEVEHRQRNALLFSSVVLALLLTLMLVNLQNQWTVALLGLGYALLAAGERLFTSLPVDTGYRRMRLILTLVVLFSHASVFYAMTV